MWLRSWAAALAGDRRPNSGRVANFGWPNRAGRVFPSPAERDTGNGAVSRGTTQAGSNCDLRGSVRRVVQPEPRIARIRDFQSARQRDSLGNSKGRTDSRLTIRQAPNYGRDGNARLNDEDRTHSRQHGGWRRRNGGSHALPVAGGGGARGFGPLPLQPRCAG